MRVKNKHSYFFNTKMFPSILRERDDENMANMASCFQFRNIKIKPKTKPRKLN